jgi:uncharacterized protein
MKKIITALSLMMIFAFGSITAQTNSKKHHVIIQLSNNDTLAWNGIMHNIKHIKDTWGDNAEVELVAYGPGIEFLMKTKATQQKEIAQFKKMGVSFMACQNSMKAHNLSPNDILTEAGFVPSGVCEVIMKEEQGWSYLKAGF